MKLAGMETKEVAGRSEKTDGKCGTTQNKCQPHVFLLFTPLSNKRKEMFKSNSRLRVPYSILANVLFIMINDGTHSKTCLKRCLLSCFCTAAI